MKDSAKAEEHKRRGNELFSAGEMEEAVKQYTLAIEADEDNYVCWGNRSAARARQGRWEEALRDAEEAIGRNREWAKGYSRKGAALHGLGRFEEAVRAYEEGLKYEPGNAGLKQGIEEAERAKSERRERANVLQNFAAYFSGDVLGRMREMPAMAPYLRDASFLEKVAQIQADPNCLMNHFQDRGIMTYIMELLKSSGQQQTQQESRKPEPRKSKPEPKSEPKPEPKPEPELSEEQKKVLKLKEEGNKLYGERRFDEALEKYREALEVDPENVNVILNCAAVQFEKGEYDECIKTCRDAVERGRAARMDYKLIARALMRMGNACLKKGELSEAIEYYNQSLTEHRDPAVLKLLRDTEKKKEEIDRNAYVDVGLSLKAKEEGNEHFKAGRFPEAIKCYTESIKRDPSNPLLLTNRAAAYSKLAEYPSVVKDCDAALAIDPNCVKAYIRKAQAHLLMRDYPKAMETCDEGSKVDPNNAELNRIFSSAVALMKRSNGEDDENANLNQAMQNPEIREILSDPAMIQILQQMSTNPNAVQDHMRNPKVAQAVNKLRAYGFVQ